MDEQQPYATWRQELEGELERARAELAETEADRERALFEVRAANNEKVEIAKGFARIMPRQVAGPLQGRRRGYEAGLDAKAGELTRLTNKATGLRQIIADRVLALEQLQIIAPADDDASEAAA